MTATIDPATRGAANALWDKLEQHFEVSRVFLFGSRARHTHTDESDADIAIILSGTVGKFIEIKLAMDDLAYEVLLDTGIRIQPFPIWQACAAFSAAQSKRLRIANKISRPMFARYLNTMYIYCSKVESGAKQPSGMALKLLSIVNKHGLQVLA
jgi:DNA-binding transcriptional regulator YiaG